MDNGAVVVTHTAQLQQLRDLADCLNTWVDALQEAVNDLADILRPRAASIARAQAALDAADELLDDLAKEQREVHNR